jgi:hypothetical protein
VEQVLLESARFPIEGCGLGISVTHGLKVY